MTETQGTQQPWTTENLEAHTRETLAFQAETQEREAREACGTCLGSGTEARSYGWHQWEIPTCRTCNGRGTV
jgi:DnaJ-class molecular chaperone